MVERKNWIKLSIVVAFVVICSAFLIEKSYIDLNKIIAQENDFHYNAISMSAIIGGFLFTGISVLISAIDNKRIERLWENNYLNNLYRAAFMGMASNVVTIVAAFVALFCVISESVLHVFAAIEVVSIIFGIVFFAWCVKHLIFIVKRIRK